MLLHCTDRLQIHRNLEREEKDEGCNVYVHHDKINDRFRIWK